MNDLRANLREDVDPPCGELRFGLASGTVWAGAVQFVSARVAVPWANAWRAPALAACAVESVGGRQRMWRQAHPGACCRWLHSVPDAAAVRNG